MKLNSTDWFKKILSVSSGLLLTCSFPDYNFSWLAWFAFVPLLAALKNASVRESFYLGFFAGFSHYITLLYWINHTLMSYAYFQLYLSLPIFLFFCSYLALYTGILSALISLTCKSPVSIFWYFPVFLVALDYIRSYFLSGFPWEFIGYSQYQYLHLIQISDVTGVYGVSFLIALSNAFLFLVFLFLKGWDWNKIKLRARYLSFASIFLVSIFGLVLNYGELRLGKMDNLILNSPCAKIAVIQGNIDQADKWDKTFQNLTINKYINLSFSTKPENPELVVWPETAVPFYFQYDLNLTGVILEGIKEAGTDFIIGSPSFVKEKDLIKYYNTAYLIDLKGKVNDRYDKSHLVPFGEYVPFKNFLPFINKLVEGTVGDFSYGEKGKIIQWKKCNLGVQICYEIIFPDLSRASVKNGAGLLVNITNDAWYGYTSAPYQHFSMAIFRSVENRRSLIRSANTGISGFIDPLGRIIEKSPIFKDAALAKMVPIISIQSFYTRFGDIFAITCFMVAILTIILKFIRRKNVIRN